jgi:hypothetical protein
MSDEPETGEGWGLGGLLLVLFPFILLALFLLVDWLFLGG